jgi:hypothetical protein
MRPNPQDDNTKDELENNTRLFLDVKWLFISKHIGNFHQNMLGFGMPKSH